MRHMRGGPECHFFKLVPSGLADELQPVSAHVDHLLSADMLTVKRKTPRSSTIARRGVGHTSAVGSLYPKYDPLCVWRSPQRCTSSMVCKPEATAREKVDESI